MSPKLRDKTPKVKRGTFAGICHGVTETQRKSFSPCASASLWHLFCRIPPVGGDILLKMTGDLDLLRQFARENSQDAFTEIVRRHVNLVYSSALRQVRSPQLAEEISQSVFADLARHAGKISGTGVPPVNSLSPWLYAVTRRTAIDVVRKESRRQLREQIAVEMNNMNATSADWTHIEPLLDDAMAALDETDRAAILLRYFENKNLREVGASLKISDDAAQKRVSRAVEKLGEFFSKRGVSVGAGGLAIVISANAVQSAPVGLAATISAAAVLAGTAVHTSTLIAATKTIAMTTLQKTFIAATLTAAIGTGIFEAHQAAQLQNQIQTLQQQQAPLAEQIRQLQRERDDATNRLASSHEENEQLKTNSNENELLKLRGQTGVLQQQVKATQSRADAAKADRSNFVNFAISQDKEQMTNSALKRLTGLKVKLGFTPDQERQIQSILLGSVESFAQVEMSRMTGSESDTDAKNQMAKLYTDEEAQITALLNSDQQSAYAEMKKEQAAASTISFANREASAMNGYLQLSPEQSQAVVVVLASLPAGQGGPGDATDTSAKEQLEIRLQALAQTLTPEQLQTYRQKKLAEIEQAAAAMQMMKSFTK
jgi:RNA polymerase sigma factor (sigma-70 family)